MTRLNKQCFKFQKIWYGQTDRSTSKYTDRHIRVKQYTPSPLEQEYNKVMKKYFYATPMVQIIFCLSAL